VTVLAEHYIKRYIVERELLGVTFAPVDLDIGELRIFTRAFEQLRSEIKRADPCAGACSRDRHDASPTGDIEHPLMRNDFGVSDQSSCRGCCKSFERYEVGPALLLSFFKLC